MPLAEAVLRQVGYENDAVELADHVRPPRSSKVGASGGAPDTDIGFQTCGLDEPQHAIDRDLLQAPREDARDGAPGKTGVRGKVGMRESPSIDLSQDGRDELCLEWC